MSNSVAASPAPARQAGLLQIARSGDRVMFGLLFAQAAATLAIGQHFGAPGLAAASTCALLLAGGVSFMTMRGRLPGRILLTICQAAFVMSQIQLGRGTIEFHFGVFVLLGLMLVYRDWRLLVFTAGLFAVHHVLFDRLQALGFGVYCTPQADLLKTMMHAIYVVAQTGAEIFLAIELRRVAIESAEMANIVRYIDRKGTICLDVAALQLASPTALLLQRTIMSLDSAMNTVNSAAGSIEVAASEIAAGNQDLSHRTEEQASNLQQTAASMEQLIGSVKTTAEAASRACEISGSAAHAAEAGGQAVGKIVETMHDISHSSREIADIVGVIDGIAFQTNILALNAAVEAARAGEQGRGFAVVASEVRSLANRSAEAAKKIKSLVGTSAGRVRAGIELVDNVGGAILGLVEQVRHVRELITGISSASQAQTRGINQIGAVVTQLDSFTQRNSALVEEGAAATESLRDQAVQLNAAVQRFELSAHGA